MLIENWSQQRAAILVYQSRIISYGKTWFINNSAVFGEAIYALIGNVTIDGDGSFIDNSAVNAWWCAIAVWKLKVLLSTKFDRLLYEQQGSSAWWSDLH